jgi:hypothetical protein
MGFEQNVLSRKFVQMAKSLIASGKERTIKDVANRLNYNYSALNQVMNGRRNIPQPIYDKYTEVYSPVLIKQAEDVVSGIIIYNQASLRVALMALAEILSIHKKESVAKTLSDLEVAVEAEEKRLLDRLRK